MKITLPDSQIFSLHSHTSYVSIPPTPTTFHPPQKATGSRIHVAVPSHPSRKRLIARTQKAHQSQIRKF